MRQTWRWFGKRDTVSLADVRQAGAAGIVSALHDTPAGTAWQTDDVAAHRRAIEAAGLTFDVVESIWMPDTIKSRTGEWRAHTDAFIASVRACAAAGVHTICYNFMPVVDWTRTDLAAPMPSGGTALRFDYADFVAYDAFVLKRPGAQSDYGAATLALAQARAAALGAQEAEALERNICAGLPGGHGGFDRDGLTAALDRFAGMGEADLAARLIEFLREVVPVAEECGARLCIHPDDPPFPLFGLPRVVSRREQVRAMLAAVDSPANGLTFCAGSYGAREDNEPLFDWIDEFGPRIHFAHLRNVQREAGEPGAHEGPAGPFHEADHLEGSSDMVAIVRALLSEERRRRAEGRSDWEIPMRPDHGHALLDDRGKADVQPGYTAIGRLKGLAELRGVMAAFDAIGT